MIKYIDSWLDAWAIWRKDHTLNLGYATRSPIYKMMQGHAETTTKNCRRRRQLIVLDDKRRVVRRHTDPMYSKATVTFNAPKIEDNPICEAMELAICALPNQLRDVVMIKYVSQFSDVNAAYILGFRKTYYQTLVNYAHHGLDGWLRALHPAMVIKVQLQWGELVPSQNAAMIE